MQENKGLDSVLAQVLHWCNFNDTGVVTSEPPGCNYDQNLGYCTSFAFLMVQNLYFFYSMLRKTDSCLNTELKNHSQVPPHWRCQCPKACQNLVTSAHFLTVLHPPYSPGVVKTIDMCSLPLVKAHPLGVLSFRSGSFSLLSIQLPKGIWHLLPSLQISLFRQILDDASWKGVHLWPPLNWLLHVFLYLLAFHLLLQRFWKWYTVANALTVNGQNRLN